MIVGVGIDLVKVERIRKAIERKKFMEITFTPAEISCYNKAGCPIGTLASRFAAKEAVFKALGTGWVKGTDVEILPDKFGKPTVTLYGETLTRSKEAKIKKIEVSLSSYEDYAVGMAVAEK